MIVIPMAGLSSRFFSAGFTVPKYMLDIDGITLFEWSVSSFEAYYATEHFVFIILDHYNTEKFVHQQIKKMGIQNYEIFKLEQVTLGQAETVYLGIQSRNIDEEMYIFNIDSRLNNFEKLPDLSAIDGYLEVFEGEGEHWSFVLPGESDSVLKTTEKIRISNLCSNGLYYFKSTKNFKKIVKDEIKNFKAGELYIAPLYNAYISDGKNIKYKKVSLSDISFCGTPSEYSETLARLEEQVK